MTNQTDAKQILSDITVHMKYAKYKPELQRRETFNEIVDRNKAMHIKKFPSLKEEIEATYQYVYDKKVLPSMRSMQFGGKPIEVAPNRVFNCAYMPIDDVRAFSETMFLLLGGTGVGFSVQNHHVEKLPEIKRPNSKRTRRFLVGDSIEGWADAVKALVHSYFNGSSRIRFDFSDVRPKGSRLVTSGGKAPGPQPLKECLIKVEGILESKENGEKLTPIEVHDMVCHIADAVLAGGIRRAALISLFSADDDEMLGAKSGNWWEINPQRGRANNSVVLMRHKVTKEFFKNLWERVKASGAGEPGFYFTYDKDWGTNPSLRKGTRVLTTDGIFPIEELEDKKFKVKNLNGEISEAKCWLSGRDKPLYKLTLQGGHTYHATAEHEWPIWDGEKYVKVATPDIQEGSYLPVIKENQLFDGDLGSYEDGFVIGWQLGDGWLTTRGDSGHLQHGFIVSKSDCEYGIDERIEKYLMGLGSQAKFSDRSSTKELNTVSNALNENLEKFGASHKSAGLPAAVWKSSEKFRKGIVDALFSSDGSVDVSKRRILFTSKHEKLVSDLSELLGFYGIKNTIRKTTRTMSLNGNPEKDYTRYDLKIQDQASILHFRNIFSLSVGYKQEKLDSLAWKRVPFANHDKIKVVSVEKTDLKEDVWDISVFDETHCFQIAHCITGNCCEIALRPFQFCNLTEVNVSNVQNQEDYEARVRAAAFIGTLQASYTDFHYLRPVWQRNTEKDSLIGVSMTGIASGAVLGLDMSAGARVVREENKRVAALIGIKPAARTTCVKPAGTTSLTLGTSSGIHAWHNDYYIRRIRVGKNEPIYSYLSIMHPELIEDEFFRPHDTAVISVPQKAPEGAITRVESALEMLERVKRVSQEWIKPGHSKGQNSHNVSATVTLKEDEWETVGEWMWENREHYNGLSVLPHSDHTYKQAPFEDCTEEVYNELMKSLSSVDLTKVVELDDNTDLKGEVACGGGACEIV
jgi:hypothetical protein